MAKELDELIEALAFLICSDPDNDLGYTPPIHRVPAAAFDGFEPIFGDHHNPDTDEVLIGDSAADQPIWPLDYASAFVASGNEPDDWPAGTWSFIRYKTLLPKEWRGILFRIYPKMIDQMSLHIPPNGKAVGARVPIAILGDGRTIEVPRQTTGLRLDAGAQWRFPHQWHGSKLNAGKGNDLSIALLGGMMLRKHYLWSVLIGEGKGPRARLFTDIPGMREVFRLRDVPPGRARRAALLHWVRAHWRKKRAPSANDRAWVHAHLRGVWSYQWNGLLCQIEPSKSDLETLAP